jgi:hypothetical protein
MCTSREAMTYTALTKRYGSRRKLANDISRLPREKRAEIAFKVAVAKAIDEHVRLGFPV